MIGNRNYKKDIVVTLITKAKNKEEAAILLNDVAHSIHSNNNPLITGGKQRRVQMSHHSSNVHFIPKKDLTK
jgi:hypothetical protein